MGQALFSQWPSAHACGENVICVHPPLQFRVLQHRIHEDEHQLGRTVAARLYSKAEGAHGTTTEMALEIGIVWS